MLKLLRKLKLLLKLLRKLLMKPLPRKRLREKLPPRKKQRKLKRRPRKTQRMLSNLLMLPPRERPKPIRESLMLKRKEVRSEESLSPRPRRSMLKPLRMKLQPNLPNNKQSTMLRKPILRKPKKLPKLLTNRP